MTMDTAEAQRAFRNALAAFATGVTIATTSDAEGRPVGVTASSFNSVSLDPPLVLWSLAKNSLSRDAFTAAGHFAIHVLTAAQEDLSNRFARSGDDKFADVAWHCGELGSPLLDQFVARFECRTRHEYEGGDHIILVGEVVSYEARDEAPLLFHGGRYAERRPRPTATPTPTVDTEHGRFGDDFLLYLISRAHFQTSRPTRETLAAHGLGMAEYLALATLSMEAPLTALELAERLAHTGHLPDGAALEKMAAGGLLTQGGDGYDLADTGRTRLIETLAIGKAAEAELATHFTAAEIAETKRVLRRIIELSGGDIPMGWRDGAPAA